MNKICFQFTIALCVISGCRRVDQFGLTYDHVEDGIRQLDEAGIDAMFDIERRIQLTSQGEFPGPTPPELTDVVAKLGGELYSLGYLRSNAIVAIVCRPNVKHCVSEAVIVVRDLDAKPVVHGVYGWVIHN